MRHQRKSPSALLLCSILAAGSLTDSCTPKPFAPRNATFHLAPAWSPDGTTIAFVRLSDNTAADVFGVYVVPVTGGIPQRIWRGFARSVDWSPDGAWLVFDTSGGLLRCRPSGDSVGVIYSGEAYFPAWSPAADSITFDDITDDWIIAVTGGVPQRLP